MYASVETRIRIRAIRVDPAGGRWTKEPGCCAQDATDRRQASMSSRRSRLGAHRRTGAPPHPLRRAGGRQPGIRTFGRLAALDCVDRRDAVSRTVLRRVSLLAEVWDGRCRRGWSNGKRVLCRRRAPAWWRLGVGGGQVASRRGPMPAAGGDLARGRCILVTYFTFKSVGCDHREMVEVASAARGAKPNRPKTHRKRGIDASAPR